MEKDVGDIAVSELKTFPLYCSCLFFKRILILTYNTHAVCNSYNFGNNNPRLRPMDTRLLRLDKGMGYVKINLKNDTKLNYVNKCRVPIKRRFQLAKFEINAGGV